uniref:Uncharacterized protein n=1 Tax=Strombidium rassoulzadegani TaxID=1082188 RepID=A0A7S3CLY4_9SPIT|mmetsp:Transcript_1622/g.2869  ORF Transcript_1622/g.2869 Transcript_1622/m.2869 type:complete len:184 (+) Transcript_1622:2192-2743(+)
MKQLKTCGDKRRLVEHFQLNLDHLRQKHQADMSDLQVEEQSIADREVPKLQSDALVLQNELAIKEGSLQNIKQEKQEFQGLIKAYQEMIHNSSSFENSLLWHQNHENLFLESLEVTNYNRSIDQANLVEEMEALFGFLEEIIKRLTGDPSAEDLYAFQQLGESDKEDLGDFLKKIGLSYHSIG